ncbi:MAG: sigma-70 family RNA polymerase sigma factor [Nitrospinaceae bacterium]|nr:sigma-70 family RNA polymerase sigma factor [Nitrospinaceae bacterium]NIR53449.1 sigma-70 family RNA polymerase sigma factor [Nitrospinaceae bacterium]NIS83852.1 sigma-70 family RNA polymerase sigma factor [Nitrospinaceae bacterium]NIT80643.1 sigma-70 family RNA polymerase sigma factor [Nitrospinaceae bacterium]NIU42971.1 sigma-70 family RNA polymerase sigma factor [Nitrospinaceae bacterium]
MPTQEEKAQDEILVRDLKAGHVEAFDKIFELYQRKIYALAFNMTRNQMDAQDITQEVLLTIYRKIDTFQGKSAFSSWVYRITLNATYMKLRSKKKDQFVQLDEGYPAFNHAGFQNEKLSDWSKSTDSLLFSNETRAMIQKAVDQLPEKEKVVFILRDVEGLSTEKVGDILDLTVPAVKSRLHRARLFLRKKLSNYFDEYNVRSSKK